MLSANGYGFRVINPKTGSVDEIGGFEEVDKYIDHHCSANLFVFAVFKGEDGSLGYVKGKEYELTVKINPKGFWISQPALCLYESLYTFLQNWTVKEWTDTL